MIKRVKKIQQIGTFSKCDNVISIVLDKFNLFYGHNTYGKSTLNDIFRALNQDEPTVLTPRISIPNDPNCEPKIEIRYIGANNQEVDYSTTLSKWTSSPSKGKILIFDSDFALRNVISGSEITRANKEFFTDFVLGESGVELSKKIQEKKQTLAQIKKDLENCKPEYLNSTRNEREIIDFVSMNISEDEAQLTTKLIVYKQSIENLTQSTKISTLPQIETVVFNFGQIITDDIEKINLLLSKDFDSFSKQFLDVFQSHLKNFTQTKSDVQSWIREGFTNHKKDDNCPFCGQSLNNVHQLMDTYSKIFNEEYKDYLNTINQEIATLLISINYETKLTSIQLSVSTVINQLTKYKTYLNEIDTDLDTTKLNQELEKLKIFLNAFVIELKAKLEEKKAKQIEKIDNISLFEDVKDQIKIVENEFFNFNNALRLQLVKCSTLRGKHQSINESQRQTELNKNMVEIRNNEKKIRRLQQNGACLKYLELFAKIKPIESQIAKDTEELETKQSEYLKSYFNDLNTYFKKLGSNGFTLNLQSDNRGYKKVFYIDVQYKGEDISQSNLMKVFSESDKRSLAFAVFLTKLKHIDNSSEMSIVFDDPVVSFDEHRIKSSIDLINELVPNFDQIFVLTHYPHYVSQTIKVKSPAKYFQLTKDNNTSSYIELDPMEFIEPEIDKCVKNIWRFINREHNESPIGDCRIFLEKYVEFRFKKQILQNSILFDGFSDLVDKLATDTSVNPEQKAILNKYRKGLNPDHHEFANANNIENDRTYATNFLEDIYNL